LDTLLKAIETSLPKPRIEVSVTIPFNRGELVSAIHERGEIISEEYTESGTLIHAMVDGAIAKKLNELG
jgi:GTP-binding protein HflX